tara:strand:- start:173 stop:739 length:567 start_codon:yes stop_codon:yes gene_type:complete
MSFYLGLDISTSIIGITVLNEDFSKYLFDYIDLTKIKSYFKKADIVRDKLKEIKDQYSIDYIGIEENLQAFRPGLSSAKTLMQLSRFNGVVSQISYELFNLEPLYINVNSARTNLQIKINKKLKLNTKEQVFEWVSNDFIKENIEFEWPTKILKSGPNKGRVKYNKCCYDISDSYVICKALIYEKQQC